MMNKKGQGLSLNVIIIAALALIVLVILVAVFTGRIGKFETGVSEVGDAELVKMRTQYSDCHPSSAVEKSFRTKFNAAESADAQEQASAEFEIEIDRCASISDKLSCEDADCKWK